MSYAISASHLLSRHDAVTLTVHDEAVGAGCVLCTQRPVTMSGCNTVASFGCAGLEKQQVELVEMYPVPLTRARLDLNPRGLPALVWACGGMI